MMLKTLFWSVASTFAIHIVLFLITPYWLYIPLLNSVYIACSIAVFVSWLPTLWHAIFHDQSYNRARHYLIGVLFAWVALTIFIVNSIFIWSTLPATSIPNQNFLAVTARFFGIAGAIFQITAPDLGQDVLYGRDRRFLWLGVACGLVAGVWSAYLQNYL